MPLGTHLLPRPKTYDDAAERFATAIAQPRITINCLRTALLCSLVLCVGLLVLNFRTAAQQRERIPRLLPAFILVTLCSLPLSRTHCTKISHRGAAMN